MPPRAPDHHGGYGKDFKPEPYLPWSVLCWYMLLIIGLVALGCAALMIHETLTIRPLLYP